MATSQGGGRLGDAPKGGQPNLGAVIRLIQTSESLLPILQQLGLKELSTGPDYDRVILLIHEQLGQMGDPTSERYRNLLQLHGHLQLVAGDTSQGPDGVARITPARITLVGGLEAHLEGLGGAIRAGDIHGYHPLPEQPYH